MLNDPDIDGKYLGTISKDFVVIAETLKEAAYQIVQQGFSKFPIFVISKQEVVIGQLLIHKTEVAINWNVYASYLDEFTQLDLVKKDKIEEFKGIYKNPEEYCCLFVIDGEFQNFVFIPYPVDSDS